MLQTYARGLIRLGSRYFVIAVVGVDDDDNDDNDEIMNYFIKQFSYS